MRTEDQLQNHLEEFCLNRLSSTEKSDLPKGGVWTNGGYHHFVYDRFYNQHLMRRRWDLGYSRIQVKCLKKNVVVKINGSGKEKLSVFTVKEFDKKEIEYKPKKLKEDRAILNENNCIRTTRYWKNNYSFK